MSGSERGGQTLPKLLLIVGEFFARHITARWDCEQKAVGRPLHFSLDGFGDGIEFAGIADASRIDFLVDQIRGYALAGVELPELKRLVDKYPEYSRIISSMDYRFVRLKKLRISAADLSKEVWYPKETILNVFRFAVQQFPGLFAMSGPRDDVLVMRNRLRLARGVVDKWERDAGQKGKPGLKAAIKPAMTVFYGFLIILLHLVFSWMRSKFFESLTGAPFILAQIGFVLFAALLQALVIYGGETVFIRLPKRTFFVVRWVAWWVFGIKKPGRIVGNLERQYEKWRS